MSLLSQATQGPRVYRPLRVLVHGPPKIGKSTFAAKARDPIFADAEEGTLELDVVRVGIPEWRFVAQLVRELTYEEHDRKTLVLDTLDSLEGLLIRHVCAEAEVSAIEQVGGGYGKGWTRVAEVWRNFTLRLAELQAKRSMNVVALAHSATATFSDPSGNDYSQWQMRLSKKSLGVWEGWVDDILFAKAVVQRESKKQKGPSKPKAKSERRVLVCGQNAGCVAGTRHDLPPELPLRWDAFAAAIHASIKRRTAVAHEEPASAEEAVDEPADAVADEAPPPAEPPMSDAEAAYSDATAAVSGIKDDDTRRELEERVDAASSVDELRALQAEAEAVVSAEAVDAIAGDQELPWDTPTAAPARGED